MNVIDAIPTELVATLAKLGARPNGDAIRLASGKFVLWPTDPKMPTGHEDLLNLASAHVRVIANHAQLVHLARNDLDLSQAGRAKKHRAATAATVDAVLGQPAALIRLEREHAATVATFYNVEPPLPANPVLAIVDAEARLFIASADARALVAALTAVEQGKQTPRQPRLVYAWRASPYPLRDEFADGLDIAWRALRRQENADEAAVLEQRAEALEWARLVIRSCCRAFRGDSGMQEPELRELIDVPAYRDSLPLWWDEHASEAGGVAAQVPGGADLANAA